MTLSNGVADVMVTNRMTVFPSSPSVTGETTTACAWCVCVSLSCEEGVVGEMEREGGGEEGGLGELGSDIKEI